MSKNGGIFPKWRGDGKELYFTAENRDLMAGDISIAGNNVTLGAPHALFRLSPSVGRNVFAVSSDGRRFYIPRAEEGPNGGDNPILVVTNWWLTLKK